MTTDVLWEKAVKIYQNEFPAECPRSCLDKHIGQIATDRSASNNSDILTCQRFGVWNVPLGKVAIIDSDHGDGHHLQSIAQIPTIYELLLS
ncbi:hypothetical protein [Escherichia coli]|uniref:hypothetical protein n=1 Tax=Escherichia coli TaxID=562 RepID=UPI001F14BEBB|nr:hypothetical protein [Escherichia coli]